MKIGVITDIHNNLPALKAVLARMQDCEHIICCGDIIGIGPHPEECVRQLMRLSNLTAVCGNHDRYLLEGMPSAVPNDEGMDEGEMGMHRWEHARLSAESVAFLRSLPHRADIELGGMRICVMHYCMDAGHRYTHFTPDPAPGDLARMFAGETAEVILYGHDHAPCVQRAGRWLFVNAGSLGCPGRERNIARAGILTVDDGLADFTPLRIEYDAEAVVSDIDRYAYPAHQDIKRFFFGIDS